MKDDIINTIGKVQSRVTQVGTTLPNPVCGALSTGQRMNNKTEVTNLHSVVYGFIKH
jgi:hypothetical protein